MQGLGNIAAQILGRPLKCTDGLGRKAIVAAEKRLEIRIPPPLREYYSLLGGLDLFNNSFHTIYGLKEIRFFKDVLVFMEEHRSACIWGIRQTDFVEDNPLVYQGYPVDCPRWSSERLVLSRWLEIALFQQAAEGYEFSGSHTDWRTVLQSLRCNGGWIKAVDDDGLVIFWQDGKFIYYLEGNEAIIGSARSFELFAVLQRDFGFRRL